MNELLAKGQELLKQYWGKCLPAVGSWALPFFNGAWHDLYSLPTQTAKAGGFWAVCFTVLLIVLVLWHIVWMSTRRPAEQFVHLFVIGVGGSLVLILLFTGAFHGTEALWKFYGHITIGLWILQPMVYGLLFAVSSTFVAYSILLAAVPIIAVVRTTVMSTNDANPGRPPPPETYHG